MCRWRKTHGVFPWAHELRASKASYRLDMTVDFLNLSGVLLVSLVSRILVSRNTRPSFDVYGHLCFVQSLKEQQRGPFDSITLRIVGASPYSQPFMWHWLVSMFDVRWLLRNQSWLNAVIDSLFVVIAFLVALSSGLSERVAIYAVAIYLLTPMWFSSISAGPRIAGFTPRLSSEVATNLFFMVSLLPTGLSEFYAVILAGMLAAFVISSAKFGVQAMLFLTPLVSLIGGTLLPILSLVAGTALALAASRGRLIGQIRSQLTHLAWYFKENLKGKMHVSGRNSFRNLFRRSEPSLKAHLTQLIHRILSENSYTSVAAKLPVIFVVVYVFIRSIGSESDTYSLTMAAPIISAGVIYFVVNLRPFLFLGEAERYLNHVAFFIALFAAEHMLEYGYEPGLWALFVYGLVYWGIETFALKKLEPPRFRQRAVEDDRVIEDLQTLTQPTVVLGYGYHVAGGIFRIILETMHRTVYCLFTGKAFSERFNALYASDYPVVKLEKLEDMADEYGIGYIVLDRRELSARGFKDWKPSARWTKRPVGGELYDIYFRPECAEGIDVATS